MKEAVQVSRVSREVRVVEGGGLPSMKSSKEGWVGVKSGKEKEREQQSW